MTAMELAEQSTGSTLNEILDFRFDVVEEIVRDTIDNIISEKTTVNEIRLNLAKYMQDIAGGVLENPDECDMYLWAAFITKELTPDELVMWQFGANLDCGPELATSVLARQIEQRLIHLLELLCLDFYSKDMEN